MLILILEKTMNRLSADDLVYKLSYFTGTENWYKHPLVRDVTYTDGVKFFCTNGGDNGAYWLLDFILLNFRQVYNLYDFVVFKIAVKNEEAKIIAFDGNGNKLKARNVNYTDLQHGTWEFWLKDNVLFLPSEY